MPPGSLMKLGITVSGKLLNHMGGVPRIQALVYDRVEVGRGVDIKYCCYAF
jgi:hypothetical protein